MGPFGPELLSTENPSVFASCSFGRRSNVGMILGRDLIQSFTVTPGTGSHLGRKTAMHITVQSYQELANTDKFGVVEVVDRPSPQQVPSTRSVQQQRLDGSHKMRNVARGFEQTVGPDADISAGTPKLTKLRGLLTTVAIHGHPVASGDCHSAFHQSSMPSESEPVCAEPVP